jgi:hypothetical protein
VVVGAFCGLGPEMGRFTVQDLTCHAESRMHFEWANGGAFDPV